MNNLHPLHQLDGHFNTMSGVKFSIFDPKPEQINIVDIANGLAYNCHFGGHTPAFFSIAEHCLLVVSLLPKNSPPALQLMALMHDAAEAYIGDMIKPLKIHFPLFGEIENKILQVIADKYSLDLTLMQEIKKYDMQAQEIEFAAFYTNKIDIDYLDPIQARRAFLQKFSMIKSSL